jgi:hypothetical protein
MKKTILSMALMLIASTTLFAQTGTPVLNNVANDELNKASFKFAEETFNFGTIKQGDIINHDFAFTNTGKEPLVISSAAGSCGCTVPTWPKDPIAPGAKSVIKVTFNSAGKMGMQDKTVTLQSNARQSSMVIHLTGTVDKPAETPKAVETDKNNNPK